MEYDRFIQEVRKLGFIKDQDSADAAVKAVLGILASRLKEPQARGLSARLPAPLDYEKLRSHQAKVALMISVDEYLAELSSQFKITLDQAGQLARTVLHVAKQAVGSDTAAELEENLSPDWAAFLKEA
ncbi:MAG: DUF2267 domain-containing protein [Endomicrobiales bacterium]